MRINNIYTVRVQESKVRAAGELSLRPSNRYFYKFHLCIPKHISNWMELSGSDRVYISKHATKIYTMAKAKTNEDDMQVTLSETVTRRYNGRVYTILKFVIPRELANRLNVYKGKEVEMRQQGDRIAMLF